MNKAKSLLLAVAAMAFTVSCSADGGYEGGGSIAQVAKRKKCKEEAVTP